MILIGDSFDSISKFGQRMASRAPNVPITKLNAPSIERVFSFEPALSQRTVVLLVQ
jgi:hypothetical protein